MSDRIPKMKSLLQTKQNVTSDKTTRCSGKNKRLFRAGQGRTFRTKRQDMGEIRDFIPTFAARETS